MRISRSAGRGTLSSAVSLASLGLALGLAAPARAVVVNDADTPDQIVDGNDVTGVGQIVVDEGDGFLGLCTGTLINPRTVIFAAHCVNEQPAGSYGAQSGGTAIGVGFQADTIPGIVNWLFGATDGGPLYQTDTAHAFYNGSYVTYNPHSLDLGPDNNFLQSDVALMAIDAPAVGVPTWELLFTPLAGQTHAVVQGYGGNGTGTTGSDGSNIDFKRRIAENMLSVLGSLDDQDTFLFGEPDGLPQNLYMMDFNDPKYNTADANPYDFDVFGDSALPKEAITAPGDSGGPLIVDQAYSRPIVVGVLSGGDRFFEDQPGASYGTTSFYQPLYLFWDWIVANNPYKYVGAKAGDGSWTDPNHWVINLDPAYQIAQNGTLVNALPTTPAAGSYDPDPNKFGKVCYLEDCEDIATGEPTTPDAAAAKGAGHAANDAANDKGSAHLTPSGSRLSGQADIDPVGDPPAEGSASVGGETVQGAPGSSGFVPDDTDGDRATGAPARYYDVTLAAAGTTTLAGATAVIDRLTIAGNDAGLTIADDAGLATLIDTTVTAGTFSVDGTYISIGDLGLVGGLLQGNGTVYAPYVVSALGAIAPGRLGTIGTLAIDGDVVLASGSRLYVDLGAGRTSDLLAIGANPISGNTGIASLGGLLALGTTGGYRPTYGDSFRILTAEGGIEGGFAAVSGFSGVLYPDVVTSANAVDVTILARPYADVIDATSPVQRAYAQLLDQSRVPSYARLSDVYGALDLLPAAALRPTLEAAAPFAQQTAVELARMASDALGKLHRDRLAELRTGEAPEGLTMIGQPLRIAQAATSRGTATDAPGMAGMGAMSATPTSVKLPQGVSAFVAGGYLDGSGRALPSQLTSNGRDDDFDGWYGAAGIEKRVSPLTTLGISVAYTHADGGHAGQHARDQLFELTGYGTFRSATGVFVNVQANGGVLKDMTRRRFSLAGLDQDLRNTETSVAYGGELVLGKEIGTNGAKLSPQVGLRYSHLRFEGGNETGGEAALDVAQRSYDALEARAGGDLTGTITRGGTKIMPRLTAFYVHDYNDRRADIAAHFVDGVGPDAIFPGASRDRSWGELGGGLTVASRAASFGLAIDASVGRQDLSYRAVRGSVSVRF